jgi:hypothetical protein
MAISYGRTIEWNYQSHYVSIPTNTVTVSDCNTLEEATREVILFALNSGWTPPRWWQFWRWRESFWWWERGDRELAWYLMREVKT